MTPIEYAYRGRWYLWGFSSAYMYYELTDDEGDYLNDALAIAGWGFATGALVVPQLLESTVGWVMTKATRSVAPIIGRAATYMAPFAAGYMIGATTGTMISHKIWGDEGAQVAMGAYSFGLLPGTEAADLTDFQYVFKPTAPGGPVSLYDLAAVGVRNTAVMLDRKRQRLPTHPNPYMI